MSNQKQKLTMSSNVPGVNLIKPFIFHSQEMLTINPVFSFYMKSYAIQKLTDLFKKLQSEGKQQDAQQVKAALM